MTTPSGTISMSQILNEFGPSASIPQAPSRSSLGNYRVNQLIAGRNWRLDSSVPTSGPISMSQLRGKTLNIVVDYSGSTEYNVNSEDRYNSSGVVVGGFRSRPTSNSSDTKKVHHVIRKKIGGSYLLGSFSPTTPNPYSYFSFLLSNSNINNYNQSATNTLGTFVISYGEIEYSEFPITGYVRDGRGRLVPRRVPPTTGSTTTSTYSGNINLSNGGVITFRKDTTVSVTSRSAGKFQATKYYRTTTVAYYPTLVSRGFASFGQTVTASWDGRTFTFTVDSTISAGPSFRTGSGWNGIVELNYTIDTGAVIGGSGGSGGNGGVNSIPAQNGGNGGDAFGVSSTCTIYLVGNIRAGAGGGGGGSFQYVDIGRGCGQRYNGDGGGGGAGIPGGRGGREQNFAPGAYDSGCGGEYRFGYNGGDGTELTGGLANTISMLRAVNRGGNGGSLSPYSPTGGGGAGGTSGGSAGSAFKVSAGSYTVVNLGGSILGGTSYGSF